MPWCPKCRTEYREGFTKCADCGSELVAEEPAEEEKIPAWLEGMPAEYIQAALEQQTEIEDTPAFRQMVEMSMAKRMQEEQETQSTEDVQNQEEPGQQKRMMPRYQYQDSVTKANDNKSSAITLLALGILGIVFVILCYFKVIPIPFNATPFFMIVMLAMFVLFIVGGIASLKNAKVYSKQAKSEDSLKNTLIEWCKQTLSAEAVDKIINAQNDTPEIVYFKRASYLKFVLNKQFMNLDQDFLEHLIDEEIYDMIFED